MKNQRDEELRQRIRDNLIDLRNKKGLKQSDIADLTGRSNNAVGSWEQGLSLPDIETLYRLSTYYNLTMEYFFTHNPEKTDDK